MCGLSNGKAGPFYKGVCFPLTTFPLVMDIRQKDGPVKVVCTGYIEDILSGIDLPKDIKVYILKNSGEGPAMTVPIAFTIP